MSVRVVWKLQSHAAGVRNVKMLKLFTAYVFTIVCTGRF